MEKTESRVVVEEVAENPYKPEMDQATLRMQIEKFYPPRMPDSVAIFGAEAFNFEKKEGINLFKNERVTWMDVPKGMSKEKVQEVLDKLPNCRIQAVYSMKPILSPGQLFNINKGVLSLEDVKKKQLIKKESGEPIMWNGAFQYKKHQVSFNGEEDIDQRPARIETIEAEVLMTEEIATEAAVTE
jgi:hypothetical protein